MATPKTSLSKKAKAETIRTGAIKVEGLVQLNKALKELPGDLKKEVAAASKAVATFVAADAKSAATGIGGVAEKTAPSIRAAASARSAGVSFGGPRYPYGAGAEFGAGHSVLRQRTTGTYEGFNQFGPWKGNGETAGYFVYPTIRRDADRIATEYTKHVDAVLKKAFPD